MAQQTICPACGAPIEYNGQEDQIRCPFCDTELKVVEEGDTTRFQVLSQPEPQKEVLSQPVEAPGRPDMETTFNNFSINESAPTAASAGAFGTEVPLPPASQGSFYTPPVSASAGTPAKVTGGSGVGRWVAIGAIALLALCGLCACLGFVAFAVLRNNGGSF